MSSDSIIGFGRTIIKSAKTIVQDVKAIVNKDIFKHEMKPNQRILWEKFRNSRLMMIIWPPGAGKSTGINFVMKHRICEDDKHKVIFAVPQTVISKSFGKITLVDDDGSEFLWDIGIDLCNMRYYQKASTVVNFLKQKQFTNNKNERTLITTHSTLARVYELLKNSDNSIFDDSTFVFDEAHHIMDNGKIANGIGKLVQLINGNQKCSIWFATATPFRGDKNCIIQKKDLAKFDKYNIPLDEHWENTIEYIETFQFLFQIYKRGEIFERIKHIIKNKQKTIIYCPFIKVNKYHFKENLMKAILEIWPECRFLDLIEENCREKEKSKILNNTKSDEFDVVLTLKIFDEGTDWVPAQQILDLAPLNSLRIMYQRFGRLWRDLFGKNSITYHYFLPYEAKFKNEEDRRIHLSNSYIAFVGSLLIQDAIQSIPYPKQKEGSLNPLQEVTTIEEETDILNDSITKILSMSASVENPTPKQVHDWIGDVVDEHIVEKDNFDREAVIVHIAKVLRRTSDNFKPSNPGKNQIKPDFQATKDLSWMREAGFDEIWSPDIASNLLIFATKVCGIEHFKQFREVYGERKTGKEWVRFAENLAASRSSKKLPCSTVLFNEYHNLYSYMQYRPELFKHIMKEYKYFPSDQSLEEIVEDAQNLAKSRPSKKLPYRQMLIKKFPIIAKEMKKHPEKFGHIGQEEYNPDRPPVEIVVQMAKDLAKSRPSKKLPPSFELMKKYPKIYLKKREYPDLFKDIPQEHTHLTLEEKYKIAKKLAKKEPNQKLPKNLNKINQPIYLATKSNPEIFADIL